MNNNKKYKIYYQVHHEEDMTYEEAQKKYGEDLGATDELVLCSVIHDDSGWKSYKYLNIVSEEIDRNEIINNFFNAWTILGFKLSDWTEDQDLWEKEHEIFKQMKLAVRELKLKNKKE